MKRIQADFEALAKFNCPDCDGIGLVILKNLKTGACRVVKCHCIVLEEPPEPHDAWSGGFAENH